MTVDTQIIKSRRAVLAAGIGGVSAVIAMAFRPLAAQAADGDPILVGREASADAGTKVTANDIYETALWGDAPIGDGVQGTGSENGVVGRGGLTGVLGRGAFCGVRGESDGLNGVPSVGGLFTTKSAASHALRTRGRVQFDQVSGVATIAKGQIKATVTPGVDIANSSKILTTLQSTAGGTTVVHRISRDMDADTFSIYLTAKATVNCYVAWFVIG
jgi:hypothetical protein